MRYGPLSYHSLGRVFPRHAVRQIWKAPKLYRARDEIVNPSAYSFIASGRIALSGLVSDLIDIGFIGSGQINITNQIDLFTSIIFVADGYIKMIDILGQNLVLNINYLPFGTINLSGISVLLSYLIFDSTGNINLLAQSILSIGLIFDTFGYINLIDLSDYYISILIDCIGAIIITGSFDVIFGIEFLYEAFGHIGLGSDIDLFINFNIYAIGYIANLIESYSYLGMIFDSFGSISINENIDVAIDVIYLTSGSLYLSNLAIVTSHIALDSLGYLLFSGLLSDIKIYRHGRFVTKISPNSKWTNTLVTYNKKLTNINTAIYTYGGLEFLYDDYGHIVEPINDVEDPSNIVNIKKNLEKLSNIVPVELEPVRISIAIDNNEDNFDYASLISKANKNLERLNNV